MAFEEKSISYSDIKNFKDSSQIIQLAIGRQIDRIFAASGTIFSPKWDLAYSRAMVQNIRSRNVYLSKILTPYVNRRFPQSITTIAEKLNENPLSNYSDLKDYNTALAELFGEIVCHLAYVRLLPPVEKTIESGRD